MSLRKLFGLTPSDPARKNRLVAAVQAKLTELPPQRAEFVAAFAGLLVGVAHADEQVSDAERAALRKEIAERAALSREEAEAVADIVVHQANAFAGIEYSSLTRIFNDLASEEEKVQLIDCLYVIATAESPVSLVEDEEIRAVATALLLSHSQFIAIRQRYKDQLEVIQALRVQRSQS